MISEADFLDEEAPGQAEEIRLQRVKETRLRNGLIKIMSDGESRAWIWDLLASCSIFDPVFSSEIAVFALNEGRRQIGLRVLGETKALCPREYLMMEREAAD